MKMFLMIVLLAVLSACTTTQTKAPVETPTVVTAPQIEAPAATPVKEVKYSAAWDGKAGTALWTASLVESLKTSGAALYDVKITDAADWCPKFNSLDTDKKTQFFVTLISTMVKRESNFKPETSYKEGFNDSKGNPVISRGLLQISKESANQKAYDCKIQSEQELHDVATNLNCGVKIIKKWVVEDKVIATSVKKSVLSSSYNHYGAARYWSVARSSSNSKAVIQAATKSLPFCN